jgi:hypothetical protein
MNTKSRNWIWLYCSIPFTLSVKLKSVFIINTHFSLKLMCNLTLEQCSFVLRGSHSLFPLSTKS